MEKEYYIDHAKNSRSPYAKLEELAIAANLPISIDGFRIKYDSSDMKRERNNYYYQDQSKSIFIFLSDKRVKLAVFDNSFAEIYDVDLDNENTLKYYSYDKGIVKEININHQSLNITTSNNLTNSFKEVLTDLAVKPNIYRHKKVELYSLEFVLPKLIEQEKRIIDPISYIPECKVVVIDKSVGTSYSSTKNVYSMLYQEDSFRITPSLFRNDILCRFAITNATNEVEKLISNPKNTDDITTLISSMRHPKIKEMTDDLLYNKENGERTKYLLRYYDDIIHALSYFQNEDLKVFYVFEDDLNRLQLK